uniref:Guanine nucleotide-binding protein G(O) subunit alpha isoform X2 n=1 Tax=Hirondellea gigas TaxID=1518452 RepID=A0A6A7GB62_9CRUS
MGLTCSSSSGEFNHYNRRINAILASESKNLPMKLLLLGAGESGKSTVLKQFRLADNQAFSTKERERAKRAIFANLWDSLSSLLAAEEEGELPVRPELRQSYEALPRKQQREPGLETIRLIARLWKDPGIQSRLTTHGSKLELLESTQHFSEKIDEILKSEYLPTDEDILLLRVRTIGINVIQILEQRTMIKIIDVGGQRSERRKWLSHFDDVAAVLFLVSLSGYARVVHEAEETNQMAEAIGVFTTIVNEKSFFKSNMILFLNKCDLSAKMIGTTPLTVCFQDYEGKENDYTEGVEYITELFQDLVVNHPVAKHKFYVHVTCAVDQAAMRLTTGTVKHICVSNILTSMI